MDQPLGMILHRLQCGAVHSSNRLQLTSARFEEVWLHQPAVSFNTLTYRLWTVKERARHGRQVIACSHLLLASYNDTPHTLTGIVL